MKILNLFSVTADGFLEFIFVGTLSCVLKSQINLREARYIYIYRYIVLASSTYPKSLESPTWTFKRAHILYIQISRVFSRVWRRLNQFIVLTLVRASISMINQVSYCCYNWKEKFYQHINGCNYMVCKPLLFNYLFLLSLFLLCLEMDH